MGAKRDRHMEHHPRNERHVHIVKEAEDIAAFAGTPVDLRS